MFMRKSTFAGILIASFSILTFLQSCKNDKNLLVSPPVPDQSFAEEFDTLDAAYNRGWRFINRSVVTGRRSWQNPSFLIPFTSYSGKNIGYLWTDYQSTASTSGTISNWAISPSITLQNGDKIIFYTRGELIPYSGLHKDFVNRMQVRINTSNTLNCGNGTDHGDFTILLLDVNPFYYEFILEAFNNPADPLYKNTKLAYPHVWTRFEATVTGLNKPVIGNFAFRYFTELAGSTGRATSIGIDKVSYIGKH
jgi:hypothetical protein